MWGNVAKDSLFTFHLPAVNNSLFMFRLQDSGLILQKEPLQSPDPRCSSVAVQMNGMQCEQTVKYSCWNIILSLLTPVPKHQHSSVFLRSRSMSCLCRLHPIQTNFGLNFLPPQQDTHLMRRQRWDETRSCNILRRLQRWKIALEKYFYLSNSKNSKSTNWFLSFILYIKT